MADSTHTPNDRSRARVTLLAAISITILALLSGALAESARADGDPASDVLVSQTLFLPQDAGVSVVQQAQLSALLTAARRDGYPIRVALIASRADLGSVTELWQHPQNNAQFLGQELALLYRGPLLVIMPGGFGFYRANTTLVRGRAVLAAIPTSAAGTGLATTALTAVQRLSAASGHPLPTPTAIVAPKSSSTDTVSWIVFAAGGALIALAWGASLRARPLQLGNVGPPPHDRARGSAPAVIGATQPSRRAGSRTRRVGLAGLGDRCLRTVVLRRRGAANRQRREAERGDEEGDRRGSQNPGSEPGRVLGARTARRLLLLLLPSRIPRTS